jgi:hypothetical protein
MAITSLLTTYVFFGVVGFLFGRSIKVKPSTLGWILLAFLVLLSQWLLPGTRVIAIDEFQIHGNQLLQALSFGTLIGLLSKHTT